MSNIVAQRADRGLGVRAAMRRVVRRSGYVPPSEVYYTAVDEALRYAGRAGAPRQLDLLADDEMAHGNVASHFFYAGEISLLRRPCVAVVGTRQVSREGAVRTQRIARELGQAGIVVVSGGANGVDTHAHIAAIEAGGKTIAVIGTPIDRVYPPENAQLQQKIYEHHLLISQFPTGSKVLRANFPQRNKLMATLSDATVVVEASDTSGTLHQAAECRRLGRWLFIARSVVENHDLTWPSKFLKYEKCIPLDDVSDITMRIKK